MSLLWDSRATPARKPRMVARTTPHTATSKVLMMPTHIAWMCGLREEYSIRAWLMS